MCRESCDHGLSHEAFDGQAGITRFDASAGKDEHIGHEAIAGWSPAHEYFESGALATLEHEARSVSRVNRRAHKGAA